MSFITLLLYITAIYIRPQEWVFAVYGWPLITILAIATIIFLLFSSFRNRNFRVIEPQSILLIVFLGCVALSHLMHFKPYFGGAWDSFIKFGPNVIMFLLFVNILNSAKRIKISIWLIIILTVILAMQGMYQFKHGLGWAGQPLVQAEEGKSLGRITWIGIFNDPNDLALAFVVAMGFLLSFIFGKTKLIIKIVSIPLIILIGQALYLTNSRGGYLALAATSVYYFLRRFRNRFIAITVGLVLAAFVLSVGPSRISDMSAEEESARGRIDAWYEGFQMLKSAPIFGVGYGMFTDYHPLTAHNSYILVAAEEGLIGLFVWIALIYLSFKSLFKISKVYGLQSTVSGLRSDLTLYTRGLESALVGFLSAAFFLSRSYIEPLYIMLALASAAAFALLEKDDYAFKGKDLGVAGAMTLTILVVTWVTMKVSLKMLS